MLQETRVPRRVAEPLTARLAHLALDTTTLDLAPNVTGAAKDVILDTLACAIGAVHTDVGQVVLGWKREQGGRPDATLVVDGTKLPMAATANVHAHLANVLDADETLHNFAHFASTIVMPALAVGEAVGARGADVIAAVTTGFDIAARIGLSIPDYDVSEAGELFRYPGSGFSWAAFGTAAAAGRLLGLDVDQLAHAFGIAYVTTPAHGCLVSYVSSMGKRSAPWHKYAMYGTIAEAGVNAALLARDGFQADPSVLDRGSEFWRAFGAQGFDWDFLEAQLGERWFITETAIKPYPFCRYGNPMLDLLGEIIHEHELKADDIDDVLVTVVPFDPIRVLVETQVPAAGLDVMSSVPYAMAMVAAGVPAGPDWWTEDNLRDPDRAAFASKVRCRVEPSWQAVLLEQIRDVGRFRRIPVTVEVSARGHVFTRSTELAKGDPFPETRLSADELSAKVHRFADQVLPRSQVDELVCAASALEGLSDVGELVALTARP